MSNVTLFNSGAGLPTYLKNIELDETTKNLAGNSGGGGKRISIKGGVFRMLVNGEEIAVNEERSMNVIVINSSPVGRTYYEATYSETEAPKPPACWSSDGAKPNGDVPEPQASTCMSCPQNIKGSGQGDSRSCRYNQRLAVLLEGDIDGDIFQLQLPATSIFGSADQGQKMPMQAYARFLAQYKIPVGGVVTEMRFDTSAATPKLTFSASRPLTEAEYQSCKERGMDAEAVRAVTMTVSQTDNVKALSDVFAPAPAKVAAQPIAAPKPKAAPKPAPVVEVADDDVIEAPVKVGSTPTAIEPATDMADLLDEWDV
jgi:hypothetical protein